MRRTLQPAYGLMLGVAIVAVVAVPAARLDAQAADPNAAPNPYRMDENWAKLPDGREDGRDDRRRDRPRRQEHLGVRPLRRATAATSSNARADHEVRCRPATWSTSFGAGMFVFPHGLYVDRDGNVWVTDGRAQERQGRTIVVKFSPDGKVLMTLGKPGVAGDGPDTFNAPSDVAGRAERRHLRRRRPRRRDQCPHREVLQGRQVHQGLGQARHGAGRVRHAARHRDGFAAAACSSPTAPTTASRSSIRTASSSPSGSSSAGRAASSSTRTTCIYVADFAVGRRRRNPGFKQGIRIGSAKDGKVTALIPDPEPAKEGTGPGTGSAAEGVAADADGNVYGAEVDARKLMRYVKK